MSKVIINATDVRNDFFKLVDRVAKTKNPIYIKKDKEVLVKLESVGRELEEDWEDTKKLLNELRGMWIDKTEEELVGRFREADKKATRKIRARKW
ncbi:MAG: hypothetical protein A3A51_01890 [Candidatus Levybacteria bacterium RIFCSPLOWO2_01_FULL_39_10]|nr:MAG: hypothetical protein A3A51_01890 [Candidatus Levybacteria bacterium RIFCSPLOWO2_01_FULL_39_10]